MAVNRLGRVCLIVACLFYKSGRVSAQSDLIAQDGETETAQDWFERGVVLSRAARWSEAREAYLHSLQQEPRVSTHFNLATASLQLHLGRATLLALDDFAQLADPRTHAEFLAEAARMRAEALDLTGTVVLEVEPSDATVEVDQESRPWPVEPEQHISLDPGPHVLMLRAPRHVTSSLHVDVARGVTTRLSTTLSRLQSAVPVRESAPRTRAEDSPWGGVLLWGGVAAVAVGVLATVLVLTLQSDPKPSASGGSLNMVFD